ncbi:MULTISPECIES: hypothetical protein [Paenibacillus]|uniref:hypothetical protein n=1 Tax=Paenibacillus TaxID=44249 RepID=UPI002FE41819
MNQSIRFVKEYPEFEKLFHKLFILRELDEWYINCCKEQSNLYGDFHDLKKVEKIENRDGYFPSFDIYLKLQNVKGEGGFLLTQEIHLQVSKIIPVYQMNYLYGIKQDKLDGILDLSGAPQTFDMLEVQKEVKEKLKQKGYIELYDKYDSSDTIFDWEEVPGIESFNRSLTVELAVFYDVLELCN